MLKGSKHSQATKDRMSDAHKQLWTDPEYRAKTIAGLKGRKYSKREDGSPAYEPNQRALCRERDNHTCQELRCSVTSESLGRLISTHHKDFNPDNHDLDNFECRCPKHHAKVHMEHNDYRTQHDTSDRGMLKGILIPLGKYTGLGM